MLIKDVSLLESGQLIKNRDVLIEGNRISKIGRGLKEDDIGETIDGRGKLAIPGLINAHTHLATAIFRGYADDMLLQPWLEEKIWPLESRLTPEDVYWGAKLACLELIRFGITCCSDMYFFPDETARAAKEMGVRAFLAAGIFDMRPELLAEAEPFIRRWQNDELISPAVGPHAAYTCSEETLCRARDLADRYNTLIHIHLCETKDEVDGFNLSKGVSPVEYLDGLNMLSPRLLAVHCVWLTPEDTHLLAARGANVVDCTVSNLKLCSGIAPLNDLLEAGVNVCLGTDGSCSNNNLNLFGEMKAVAIVQKNAYNSPAAFPAAQVWHMATAGGYRALGLEMGLREGALADLALIDLRQPWLCPQSNMVSHLVYSMTGEVDTTIVNGQVLMRNGIIPGEAEIMEEAQRRFLRQTSSD
jgi:5-methylthioadenosine/S-adenosylhomocysteine deaminase